jgi:SNF2 family DNA or RNA helicase
MASRLEALGIGHYVVTGDTPHDTRARYIQEFQEGSGQVFIGTLSTLGESVTLHRASNAIFLDRSWNPATNDQGADRIYRIGQTKPVTITHLVAVGTVDELRVLPVIQDKAALRELILGG